MNEHIHMLLDQLEAFGTDEEVHKWKNSLFMSQTDYTNKDAVDEWYENIKNQHGPRLEGYDPCFKELPLYVASARELPVFDTLTVCGLCSR